MELIDLVKCCQLGDLEAFNKLYGIYHERALKTAYLISGHGGVAEDIAQEAFIQCFYGLKSLRNPERFNSWFYRLLVRISWRMMSKNKYTLYADEISEGLDHQDIHADVEKIAETNETHRKIQESLKTLSKPMKTAVILYYYNGMTVGEIAKVLHCFEGTVKSRLYHARKYIKEDLEEYFREDIVKAVYRGKECGNNG